MKILIVSQYYYPEQFQINDIAPELVRMGHSVTVLCGVPNYPAGRVFPGYDNPAERKVREREYFEKTGVKVIHVEQIPRGNNPIKLLLNYFSFVSNSKKAVRRLPHDFDVVLGYQLSPITSMYAAVEYKKQTGCPLVFYTLDLWPVSAESMLRGKTWPFYQMVKSISRKIYGAADRILVTSRPFIDYLHRVDNVPLERIGYLPQHAGASMLNQKLAADDNGVSDFMFAGNLGQGQRLDVIVDAAAILGPRKDYLVHIVGDGRMRSRLESLVAEKGLKDNFVFYGNRKRDDMPSFYRQADALLITLRGNNEVGDTMPGKLQMYMTVGKPILGAINGAANEVINEAGCGKCVAAGDCNGLAGLMLDYIEHPSAYAECGANARKYFAANFTLEKFMDGLCGELNKLIVK